MMMKKTEFLIEYSNITHKMNNGLLARALIEDVERLLQINIYILTIYSTIGCSEDNYIVLHAPEFFHCVSKNLTEIIKIADKYLYSFIEKEADHNMFLYIEDDPPCREKTFAEKREMMINCFQNFTAFELNFREGYMLHRLRISLLKQDKDTDDVIQLIA